MTYNSKIILGMMASAAAGAAMGVLMAPGKGSETRKRLKNAFSRVTINDDKTTAAPAKRNATAKKAQRPRKRVKA